MTQTKKVIELCLKSKQGAIYHVTDIHGDMELLRESLFILGFVEGQDTLIVGGDMIDRGAQSYDVAQFCRHTEGVYALKGNHEQLMISAIQHGGEKLQVWKSNGGAEWEGYYSQGVLKDLVSWFTSLPTAIELLIDGEIRLFCSHAAYPLLDAEPWPSIKRKLNSGSECAEVIEHFMLWDRKVERVLGEVVVPDFDAVIHGHSIQKGGAIVKGNRIYSDTGAFLGGDNGLTILEYKPNGEVLGLFRQHMFTRDPWTGHIAMR